MKNQLRGRRRTCLPQAGRLGRQALSLGLETLDLAMIHQQALATLVPPAGPAAGNPGLFRRAEAFFVEAIKPIEQYHRAAMETNVRLRQLNQALQQRTRELAAANRRLKRESIRRRTGEKALRKSQHHYRLLLEQSNRQQKQLRLLARQILTALEEERKKISRELHDEIVQILTGINVHLATLSKEAAFNAAGLRQTISHTQRLVAKSVNIVHRFALELRPTLLDDLGLVPALQSYMKEFSKRTGLRIRFTAAAGLDKPDAIDGARRTVLYRVVQSALTNIARHARASRATVSLRNHGLAVHLIIRDDGEGFEVERVLQTKRHKRLGLLGMRERVEMVGGSIAVESAPGQGTTVRVKIPLTNGSRASSIELSEPFMLKPPRRSSTLASQR